VRIAGAGEYAGFFEKQRVNSAKGGAAMKAKAAQRSPLEPTGSPEKPKAGPKSPSFSFSFSKKKKGDPVFFENLPSLLAAIPKDTKENWGKLYSQDFIDRELLLAWNFYSVKPPKRLADWSRALGGWLERTTKWAERDAKAERKDMPDDGDLGGEYALR
jgi:hypothetical protein